MTGRLVLGINFGTNHAAAALVSGGRVLAAAEEECFTRVKHTKQLPPQAAQDLVVVTTGERLRLRDPFDVEVDLAALLTATRSPSPD